VRHGRSIGRYRGGVRPHHNRTIGSRDSSVLVDLRVLHEGIDLLLGHIVVLGVLFEVRLELGLLLDLLPRLLVVVRGGFRGGG